jgi:hypothetical protein
MAKHFPHRNQPEYTYPELIRFIGVNGVFNRVVVLGAQFAHPLKSGSAPARATIDLSWDREVMKSWWMFIQANEWRLLTHKERTEYPREILEEYVPKVLEKLDES